MEGTISGAAHRMGARILRRFLIQIFVTGWEDAKLKAKRLEIPWESLSITM